MVTEVVGLFETVPQVLDSPKIGLDQSLKWIALSNSICTYASCETTSNIGELLTLRSIKVLLLSAELWLIINCEYKC